jgi:hypothetical protein
MLPDAWLDRMLWLRMQAFRWTHWRPLQIASRNPRQTQERLLLEILRKNAGTHFGQRYGFAAISDYAGFARSVPVQTYETLRPFVEEQERSGAPALTTASPVMYAQTSGTTGKPKLIPIVPEVLKAYRWSQGVQSFLQFEADPSAFYGHLLGIVSPATEGVRESGMPYGSASGHIYENMPALARTKYVVPAKVFDITDYELKYLVILRLALAHRDISYIGVANPSTLLKLLSLLRANRSALVDDLDRETFWRSSELTPDVRRAIEPRLACDADRRYEVARILNLLEPDFSDLWPDLRLVVTWTGGSCGIALAAVRAALPTRTRISELGYLSSEFRGTITVDVKLNLGMPTIHENFFEFVEREAWEAGRKEFCTIDAVKTGTDYYIFVTTPAGLYRYFMNDIVTVTGSFYATPTIQFLQKGKGVTNITGEKLYENQVIQAVREVEDSVGHASVFFLMLAVPERAIYRLIIEWPPSYAVSVHEIAERIDKRLGELNLEYEGKRLSGRLEPLELLPVAPGTGDLYKKRCLDKGQREAQFKIVALQYVEDCAFDFQNCKVDSLPADQGL